MLWVSIAYSGRARSLFSKAYIWSVAIYELQVDNWLMAWMGFVFMVCNYSLCILIILCFGMRSI